jgi:hypothetical protein
VAKAFKESFSSMEEMNAATPEQIGVALILHMQTQGNRFSPHNFQSDINHWYGNQGSPSWLAQRVSEGMQWALQMMLAVHRVSLIEVSNAGAREKLPNFDLRLSRK